MVLTSGDLFSETLQIKLAEKLQGNEFSESCEKAIR